MFQLMMLDSIILQANWLENGYAIVAGVAVFSIGLAIERITTYIRKRHDNGLKSSYDINTLFDNYNNLKKSVDETLQNQYEGKMINKELIAKMDIMMDSTKESKKAYSKILEVLYRHDTQIRLMANKRNMETDVLDSMRMFEDDDENKRD